MGSRPCTIDHSVVEPCSTQGKSVAQGQGGWSAACTSSCERRFAGDLLCPSWPFPAGRRLARALAGSRGCRSRASPMAPISLEPALSPTCRGLGEAQGCVPGRMLTLRFSGWSWCHWGGWASASVCVWHAGALPEISALTTRKTSLLLLD